MSRSHSEALPEVSAVPDDGPQVAPVRRSAEIARRIRRDPVAMVAVVVLALLVLSAIFAPWLTGYDPNVVAVGDRLRPLGTAGHLLGTDELGRDMLTRLLYGGRLSLTTGIVPVAVAAVAGTLLGAFIAYVGGTVGAALGRVLDMSYAFPAILIGIAVTASLGPGVVNSLLALSLAFIPPVARVAESATRQVMVEEYLEAARLSGARWWQVLLHHVLPTIAGPVFVYAASLVGLSISVGAGLSFLGLGAPPPTAEWGAMLNSLRDALYTVPVVVALPGLFIFLASAGFNILSDSFRDALDVRR
ncbi:ABC transporter permease [Amycolatopsis jejuensis]|uniref:ABC transporter permease n=1 Tax=Amycolatopsis jejuensis TaxID=330084 RepID=UPI0006918B7F|nr:ABC transporter permease [Amycolatopsis jejuensis]